MELIWVVVPRNASRLVWLLPQVRVRAGGEMSVQRRVYRPDKAGFVAVHPAHAAEMVNQGCVLVVRGQGGR